MFPLIITKEKTGMWDNSKKRLRKKEIENLSLQEIELLRISKISKKTLGKSKKGHSNGKIIIQYTLDLNYVNEFPSCRNAGLVCKFGAESIRRCVVGEQKTAYGYIWKYKSEQNSK